MIDKIETKRKLRQAKLWCSRHPWGGQDPLIAYNLDTEALTEPGRPTRLLLSLDVGYHASGWWRNADYDRCFHLSVSHPRPPLLTIPPMLPEAPEERETRAWAELVFGDYAKWTWLEPPAGTIDPHRLPGVSHVRLFLDRNNRPILPQGEVYNLKPWADGSSPAKVFR